MEDNLLASFTKAARNENMILNKNNFTVQFHWECLKKNAYLGMAYCSKENSKDEIGFIWITERRDRFFRNTELIIYIE